MTRPLEHQTVAVVAFGLGSMSQMPPSQRQAGALTTLAEELDARGVLPDLLSALAEGPREALMLAIQLDKSRMRRGGRVGFAATS
ncbi:Uncharacterised protein [Mycobacteroides abscessus subsp. bolletii]|uniref:SRR1 family protein n=1 Tax=Mycobacteroides abscessus TaxID=36809 RepID=UPI0009A6D3CD|nr:SRR1 family protein [Mycobacteroides abscessus]SKX80647.1 Uncharacterised protein [Mycobacteroides abscessus subsp. bolletii]